VCSTSRTKKIRDHVSTIAACFDAAWRASSFAFLRSLPGGQEQEPHQDYSPEDLARTAATNPDSIPASAIISLMDGTSLKVFPGCYDRANRSGELIQLKPGDCIIFRGDLVHCGVAYSVENTRMHCYLTLEDTDWAPDSVASARPRINVCQYCGRQDLHDNIIRQHRHYCEGNPKGPLTEPNEISVRNKK
jgi:hypothetical protein